MTIRKCKHCTHTTNSFRLHAEHLANEHWEIISSKKNQKKIKRKYIQGQVAFTGYVNGVCKYCNGTGVKRSIQCWKDKETGDLVFNSTGNNVKCLHCNI